MPRALGMIVAAMSLLAACSDGSDEGTLTVSPLRSAAAGASTTVEDGADPDPAPLADPTGAGDDSATPGQTSALHDEVVDLLGRYDLAITALYSDPLAAGDDSHPASRAWLEVVEAGTQLDREVRGRILASGRDDAMAVIPPTGAATSFVNTATAVEESSDGSITWTNCGFSPGIGVGLDGGEVLDDSRAHTSGTGRAVRESDGTLKLVELWDDSTEVLGPDATNPCGDRP